MRRLTVPFALVVLVLQACASDPSLTVYAEEAESLITAMNARLDELEAEIEDTEDLDEIKWYARERVIARNVFLGGFDTLDPPGDLDEFHATALDILNRLVEAETALADRAEAAEPGGSIGALWDTPEGIAARAADEEAVALCLAAEARLDTTERAEFEGVPWIPAEMKEIVFVAFGCVGEDR
jgi:hypothetical protein